MEHINTFKLKQHKINVQKQADYNDTYSPVLVYSEVTSDLASRKMYSGADNTLSEIQILYKYDQTFYLFSSCLVSESVDLLHGLCNFYTSTK